MLVLAASLGELPTAALAVLAAPQHFRCPLHLLLLQAWRETALAPTQGVRETPVEERQRAPRRLAPLIPCIFQAQAALANKALTYKVATAGACFWRVAVAVAVAPANFHIITAGLAGNRRRLARLAALVATKQLAKPQA